MQVELNIFKEIKIAYISFYENNYELKKTIMLEYSQDMEDIEFQILLHGYKILKMISVSSHNYLEIFKLVTI